MSPNPPNFLMNFVCVIADFFELQSKHAATPLAIVVAPSLALGMR